MDTVLSHEPESETHERWDGLLAAAGPRDHIVQLYQDQQFLNRAVCRFAAGAIANGEGVILVPTAAHWEAFRPRLEAEGVDVTARKAAGQLTVVDADELLPRFMNDAMPDAPVFLGLAADVIAKARGEGRYPKVRWWGEMVNVLWEQGNVAASMSLEDQFDRLAHHHEIAIFCSFVMDNFNSEVHSRLAAAAGAKSLSPDSGRRLCPPRTGGERCAATDRRCGRRSGSRAAATLELLADVSNAALAGVAACALAREPAGCCGVRVDTQPALYHGAYESAE